MWKTLENNFVSLAKWIKKREYLQINYAWIIINFINYVSIIETYYKLLLIKA